MLNEKSTSFAGDMRQTWHKECVRGREKHICLARAQNLSQGVRRTNLLRKGKEGSKQLLESLQESDIKLITLMGEE